MPDAGIDPRLCILCIMDVFSLIQEVYGTGWSEVNAPL